MFSPAGGAEQVGQPPAFLDRLSTLATIDSRRSRQLILLRVVLGVNTVSSSIEREIRTSSAPDVRFLGVTICRCQKKTPPKKHQNVYSASRDVNRICDLYIPPLPSSNRIACCTATSSFWSGHSSGRLYHGDFVWFLSRACPLSIDDPSYSYLELPFFESVLFEKMDAGDGRFPCVLDRV